MENQENEQVIIENEIVEEKVYATPPNDNGLTRGIDGFFLGIKNFFLYLFGVIVTPFGELDLFRQILKGAGIALIIAGLIYLTVVILIFLVGAALVIFGIFSLAGDGDEEILIKDKYGKVERFKKRY